jgi:spermidine/putrescine transport system ATP-binding protein
VNPIIQLNNLSKSYGEQAAIHSLNLDIYNGEFLTILGPSGCGKTTLLRLLAGFETADEGSILLNKKVITHLPPEKRHINMVFQNYALFPHMSVYDNIAFGLKCQKVDKAAIEQRVKEIIKRVGLEHLARRKPRELSGGQQQRVAIARAIVNEPLVLLLDEPFSALDYHLRKKTRIELKALQRRLNITFILVTHDQEEALSLSDRVVVMNHGDIEQVGTPRDIYEEPKSLYVAQFIGEANIFKSPVFSLENNKIEVEIAGHRIHLNNKYNFKVNDIVNIVMRPEDIEVWGLNEVEGNEERLRGIVSEVIYKGSTVDLVVTLENGQQLFVTEFFDEDDENLEYEMGEAVYIQWKRGWEVLLPNDEI